MGGHEMVVNAVGWIVHFIFMLGYWMFLSAPVWIVAWLIIDKVRRGK